MYIAAFLIVIVGLLVFYLVKFVFPIATGFAAKNMSSALFIQNRTEADVFAHELEYFPLNKVRIKVDKPTGMVTATLFGFAKRAAIYRPGIGSTLLNQATAETIAAFKLSEKSIHNPDPLQPWPKGNGLTAEFPPELDPEKIEQALSNVFAARHKSKSKPAGTKAALVIYDGKLIAEKYAEGYNEESLFLGWSITKSLTGALIGILVKKGLLNEEDKAPVAAWKGTAKEAITLKHILQQTTGLNFVEKYGRPGHVTKMLFSVGKMAAYVAGLKLKHKPGSFFNYSSGNSNLLSQVVRDAVGEDEYHDFPYKALFEKIDAPGFQLEADASAMYVGSSYCYANIKDYARFGLLYYQNGRYSGEQILPQDWVSKTVQPSEAANSNQYGYQFWLNGKNRDGKKAYPSAPDDLYCAHGYGAQGIYIIPSKKLIVLRFGLYEYDEDRFLNDVLTAIKQ